jgi:hypothetical protein
MDQIQREREDALDHANGGTTMRDEPMEQVVSHITVVGTVSMWGKLFVGKHNGRILGWVVDTWTERGIEPHLRPKLHWISRADDKFYHMETSGDNRIAITILDEDTEVELNRAVVIKDTLARWEGEWVREQSKC